MTFATFIPPDVSAGNLKITIKLDTGELERIAAQIDKETEWVVRHLGFNLEGFAKKMAPIDTGALRNSIYTVTSKHDGFEKAQAAAKSKNPDVEIVQIPKPDDNFVAHVGPCVEYGVHQEFGAPNANVPEHPYMTPAAEQVTGIANDAKTWERLVK